MRIKFTDNSATTPPPKHTENSFIFDEDDILYCLERRQPELQQQKSSNILISAMKTLNIQNYIYFKYVYLFGIRRTNDYIWSAFIFEFQIILILKTPLWAKKQNKPKCGMVTLLLLDGCAAYTRKVYNTVLRPYTYSYTCMYIQLIEIIFNNKQFSYIHVYCIHYVTKYVKRGLSQRNTWSTKLLQSLRKSVHFGGQFTVFLLYGQLDTYYNGTFYIPFSSSSSSNQSLKSSISPPFMQQEIVIQPTG